LAVVETIKNGGKVKLLEENEMPQPKGDLAAI